MDTKFIILILGLLIFFYLLQIKHTNLAGYNLNLKTDLNPTNIGFVKPEHSLLKVLNTVSSTALSIFFRFKISYSNLEAKLPIA